MAENFGLIDKIQRYCIHDGEGIRTVVFLKGCEMRCPWCSNPETQGRTIQLARSAFKCEACGRCAEVCPVGAISRDNKYTLDLKKCTQCGKCVRSCPKEAWVFYGQKMTAKEVVAEIEKDRPFYARSGGGVTFSGGECTNQWEFLLEMLKLCKGAGIDTAIESNAHAPAHVMEAISPYVDTFLLDIKHMDSVKHKEATGFENDRVLKNIRDVVFRYEKPLMLRVPIIPGFNDDRENIEKTADFAEELNKSGKLKKVNILPYHAYGVRKYDILDMPYALRELQPPTDTEIDEIIDVFCEKGIAVQKGG